MPDDFLAQHLLEVIEDFEEVRGTTRAIRNRLVQQHDWIPLKDVRISVFEQIDNLIRSLSLSLALSLRGFSNREWIHQLLFENANISEVQEEVETLAVRSQLATFHRLGFMYGLTQIIEGAIRSMLRAFDSSDKASDSIGSVCKRLAQKMDEATCLQEFREAFDLLRKIRNTIHNNGIHQSKNGVGEMIMEYGGEKFTFEDGKLHDSARFSVLSRITSDMISMFRTLVEDPNIRDLPVVLGPTTHKWQP